MKRKNIWFILLFFYILFIFSNSLTPAARSSEQSGFVLAMARRILGLAGFSAEWLTEHVVRKCAHFSEYTLLGILLFQSMKNLDCGIVIKRQIHTAAFFFIPFVDETLQLFTEGRSGQISDVWLDMSGVLTGTLLTLLTAWLLSVMEKKRRKRTGSRNGRKKYQDCSAV